MALLFIFSCGEKKEPVADQKALAGVETYKGQKSEEEMTRQFITGYLADLNATDWKSKVPKYLKANSQEFLEQHTVFRNSFPNYKSTIKHMAVDGNEAIVWINITANYAETYTFEDAYIQEAINGLEAKNQALSWDEVWYFDSVEGRFGDKWDFLKDNHAVLSGLNVYD